MDIPSGQIRITAIPNTDLELIDSKSTIITHRATLQDGGIDHTTDPIIDRTTGEGIGTTQGIIMGRIIIVHTILGHTMTALIVRPTNLDLLAMTDQVHRESIAAEDEDISTYRGGRLCKASPFVISTLQNL